MTKFNIINHSVNSIGKLVGSEKNVSFSFLFTFNALFYLFRNNTIRGNISMNLKNS